MSEKDQRLLARAALWCAEVLEGCEDGRCWDTSAEVRRIVSEIGLDLEAETRVVEELANEGVAADFWERLRVAA